MDPERSSPTFRQWRRRNDATMAPDRGFTKQLKCLDKDFEVVWDWGSEVWEIWKFPSDGGMPHYVMKIVAKGKTYRELGADIILRLQESARLNQMSAKHIGDYLDELDEQEQRRKRKEFRSKIRAIARETYNYAHNVLQIQVPRKFKIARVVNETE